MVVWGILLLTVERGDVASNGDIRDIDSNGGMGIFIYKYIGCNSYNKTNKCTNVKIIFLHTICFNCDMFRSILIIFTELLNINKAYKNTNAY